MRPQPPHAGFTLLELLVALVVLGFLMIGLTQGVQFGVRAWDQQQRIVTRNADLDSVDRVLRLLLTQAQPPSAPDRPSLHGDSNTVEFVTELPDGAPAELTRLARVSLLVDGGHQLVLRWASQPHAELIGLPPPRHEDVLMGGVDHLQLAYHARGGDWSSLWTAAALPQLIRLRIVFVAGGRHWPDLLVAPMRDSISENGE